MAPHHRWAIMLMLVIALGGCTPGAAPTPEPPTPTPRARAEQIAQATEIAARITATAAARALPTTTPTPRASAPPSSGFTGKPGKGQPLKATPIEWRAAPLDGGYGHRDPAGRFALSVPLGWEEYPPEIVNSAALFIAPPGLANRPAELNVFVWDMPQVNWVLPLSDITNMAMADVRDYFGEDYTFVRLERIDYNGLQIDRLICHDALDDYHLVQAYMIVGHTLHIVTFFTPTEKFGINLPLFDSILASYSPNTR